MVKQLYGSYFLETLKNIFLQENRVMELSIILKNLSCFDIEYNFKRKPIKDSIIVVLDNLLSRGFPTLPTIFIEDIFSDKFKISKKEFNNKTGEILYNVGDNLKTYKELIYDSLFIIEPRITKDIKLSINFQTWEAHNGSEYEEQFFNYILPEKFHKSLRQLTERQRTIKSILKYSKSLESKIEKSLGILKNDFYRQRVDFSVEFPKTEGFANGLIIEIDGPQHNETSQRILDKKRDEITKKNGWASTVRIKIDDLYNKDKFEEINNFLNHPYFKKIKNNYDNPIFNKEYGLDALQIALSPIAIARIQKTIIFLILSGFLKLSKKIWNIAIIERDVPCAFLAIEDLKQIFNNIFLLEGKNRKLPEIKLKIFNTEEFKYCKLNEGIETETIRNFNSDKFFDVIIDISVLQRTGLDYFVIDKMENNRKYIKIRSSLSQKEHHLVKSAKPIKYIIPDTNQPEPLIYFLRNIFRKIEFREGQVDILRKTLNLQNVIALLPTGAGKSLTYQLSVLLQPGIALIIDPLKSLMRDQNDNLKAAGLELTAFINSSLKAYERNIVSENMVKGFYQFVFISPERLQIAEFRKYLQSMNETFFTYCIVDEAHCVSEWGHDFRTSYLSLGKNAKKYCKTLADQITIIGLTGTASFEVLADVQRELDIGDESAIIAPAKYEREELKFEVISVETLDNEENDFFIKENVAEKKLDSLYNLLDKISQNNWDSGSKYDSLIDFFNRSLKYKNNGIIFCPHVGWKFGVNHIANKISEKFEKINSLIGQYAGSLEEDDLIDLKQIQDDFKNDKLALLIATKAFGMGIDKPNIRFTIHFNMPHSLEAFYQEAGRAGRDRNTAFCYILYSPTKLSNKITVDKSLMLSFFNAAFRGQEKEKNILWELLNEITYPDKKQIDDLNSELENKEIEFFDELDFLNDLEDPHLKVWFGKYPVRKRNRDVHKRLYLNSNPFPNSVGWIDLLTEERVPQDNQEKGMFDYSKSKYILDKLYQWLIKKKPSDISFMDWILFRESKPNGKGIETLLQEYEADIVHIEFTNKIYQTIFDSLSKNDLAIDEKMYEKAYNYSANYEEFIKSLERSYRKKSNVIFSIDNKLKQYIKLNYSKIRDRQDTFKAVYRLSLIGIIDEYEIDYNSKTIKAKIKKKDDNVYIKNLTDYIGKYVSVEEKLQIPTKIMNYKGNSIIQKCCGFLIDFVYSKIASKRRQAITNMEEAIKAALNNGNFGDFVNTYFDSRFTPELKKYIHNYSIEIVWDLISRSKGDPNSINHIRGACDRLLEDNPENAAFLLLRAFARFLIPLYNKKDALLDFKKGWLFFKKNKKWTKKEYLKNLSKFYRLTVKYDSSLKKILGREILFEHGIWLKSFNQKFLKDIKNERN